MHPQGSKLPAYRGTITKQEGQRPTQETRRPGYEGQGAGLLDNPTHLCPVGPASTYPTQPQHRPRVAHGSPDAGRPRAAANIQGQHPLEKRLKNLIQDARGLAEACLQGGSLTTCARGLQDKTRFHDETCILTTR